MNNVLVEVAESLKQSSPVVKDRLVSVLVERELVKRVDLLDKGLVKLRELKRDLDKIRPVDKFTADGQKVPGDFTKQEFETLKKAREKFTKLESALQKAFEGQEFDKLSNLVAGKETTTDNEPAE